MFIKPFLIVLIVILLCCNCKNDSSVINLTYSEQQQFYHIKNWCYIILSKVPKLDNLLLGPQMFIVKTLISWNAHSRYFYTQTERRGNRQTARETEKETVRVCERCRKTDIGVRHKTDHWKNPLASFGISWKGLPFSGKLF